MKIAIVNTFNPFVYGGAEYVINDLIDQLKKNPKSRSIPFYNTILNISIQTF